MFRGLAFKFKRWQEAGLISDDQVSAILAFEHKRKEGKLARDLTKVGIFAIIIGMLSLVAANWYEISENTKLLGHFILNVAIAFIMVRIDQTRHPIAKDFCVLLLFGSFLTFIALIGQIFQLHGDIHTTLTFWWLICTPFIWWYGRSYIIAVPWLSVGVIALYWNIIEYSDASEDNFWIIASLFSFFLPMALLIAARSNWLQMHKPDFAEAFRKLGLYIPAITATFATLLLYHADRLATHPMHLVLFAIGLVIILLFFKPQPNHQDQADLRLYLVLSGFLVILPFALGQAYTLLGMISFILYWLFMAWLGDRTHSNTLMTWAIRLVILRLFIIYLEVFGGLLATGAGLIISGILLLVVLRYFNHLVETGRKWISHETA